LGFVVTRPAVVQCVINAMKYCGRPVHERGMKKTDVINIDVFTLLPKSY
jgi:hypothetical protein